MKLAIGIILLLAGLWFLYGTIRMCPPGTRRGKMLWPSTRGDIVRRVFLVLASVGPGVALITGASWWWLFLAVAVLCLWAEVENRVRRTRLEEMLEERKKYTKE